MYILEHPVYALLSFLFFYFFLILAVPFCLSIRSFSTSHESVLISLLLLQLFHLLALPSLLIEHSDSSFPSLFRSIAFSSAMHVTLSLPSSFVSSFFFFLYLLVLYCCLLFTAFSLRYNFLFSLALSVCSIVHIISFFFLCISVYSISYYFCLLFFHSSTCSSFSLLLTLSLLHACSLFSLFSFLISLAPSFSHALCFSLFFSLLLAFSFSSHSSL